MIGCMDDVTFLGGNNLICWCSKLDVGMKSVVVVMFVLQTESVCG